jgi:hypothetical protein
MDIRPIDWRDLPILLRYRHRGQFFDTASVLTRGPALISAGALLSYLGSATGVFTFLANNFDQTEPILGQVTHPMGSHLARLSFMAPETAFEGDNSMALLENIMIQTGSRGAYHLLAEVDERSPAFEMLRASNFALYVRQRIWQMDLCVDGVEKATQWRPIEGTDIIALRNLYNSLVPGLVQQIEPPPDDNISGLAYWQENELLAYSEVRSGPHGIWLQPFIHPEVTEVAQCLASLFCILPNRRSRAVYLCVRSYQSWMEHDLEELQASVGPNQAVMVRHLAITKKAERGFPIPALEGKQPEATVPFAQVESKN